MADTELGDLSAASALDGSELVYLVQSGADAQGTVNQIEDFILTTAKGVHVAAADPTVNDDVGDGYTVGWKWVNSTTGAEFMLIDSSSGAAVWKHSSPEWQILDTQSPTGSGTISIPASGSISTLYTDLRVRVQGLTHNDGSNRNISLQISDDGTNWSSAVGLMTANVASATAIYGEFEIKNYRSSNPKNCFGSVHTAVDTLNNTVRHIHISAETGALTHMRLVWGAGNNTAGSVTLLAR